MILDSGLLFLAPCILYHSQCWWFNVFISFKNKFLISFVHFDIVYNRMLFAKRAVTFKNNVYFGFSIHWVFRTSDASLTLK